MQELAPAYAAASRRTPEYKGAPMQDLVNRLNSAQELTRQLLVRL